MQLVAAELSVPPLHRGIQQSHKPGWRGRRRGLQQRGLKFSGPQKILVKTRRLKVPIDHEHAAPSACKLHRRIGERHCAADTTLPRVEGDYRPEWCG